MDKKIKNQKELPPHFQPLKKCIVIEFQGPDAKREQSTLVFNKDRVVIGSVVSADVRLVGKGVSPIHAVIELQAGREASGAVATIYDLASESGLTINGQKHVTHSLKNGDQIVIGSHFFKVSVDDVEKLTTKGAKTSDTPEQKLFFNPQEDLRPLILEDERGVEEIFDYRPAMKQAIEVVMSWHGSILDVEHFVKEPKVVIGTTRASHFGIPPLLSAKEFPVIKRSGENYSLIVDTQMKGVLQSKGLLLGLDKVRAQANRTEEGFVIPLEKDDFAKISVGEIDFYLSFTAAPPRLKRKRLLDKDPFFFRILTVSTAFTLGLILALMNIKVTPSIDAEELPERIATILYQPEKFTAHIQKPPPVKPVPKPPVEAKPTPTATPTKVVKVEIQPKPQASPKEIPKQMNVSEQKKPAPPKPVAQGSSQQQKAARSETEGKEGEGARAKGQEGTRGTKTAPVNAENKTQARRPSPEGGTGRGGGQSQVADKGNLDFLKGTTSKIENLLGNTASRLGQGGQKLQGFGGFDTRGSGGAALSGTGSGGGGTADSLGGLSDKGRGGGRVGTGLGAAGTGSSIVGGQSRVSIRTGGPEETVVMGSIDKDAIEAALLAHRDEFRLCYEREINAENPDLAGRIGTNFVIGPSGRVTQAGIDSTTMNNANVEGCVVNVIKRIQFPEPLGGGVVQVKYPFKFRPAGK